MARKSGVWMPLYWGDYLSDTAHLSTIGHGAYFLMIGHYWTSGKPLPNNDEQLRCITRLDKAEWRKLKPTLAAFFLISDTHWHHKRIDEELARAAEVVNKRVRAGVASAEARRQHVLNTCSTHGVTQPPTQDEHKGEHNTQHNTQHNGRHSQSPSPSSLRSEVTKPNGLVVSLPEKSASEEDEAINQMLKLFNDLAARIGLPVVHKFEADRRSKARLRLKECRGLDGWVEALRRVEASSFLRGATGWRADFDFLMQHKSFRKLLEGGYDDKPSISNGEVSERHAPSGPPPSLRGGGLETPDPG